MPRKFTFKFPAGPGIESSAPLKNDSARKTKPRPGIDAPFDRRRPCGTPADKCCLRWRTVPVAGSRFAEPAVEKRPARSTRKSYAEHDRLPKRSTLPRQPTRLEPGTGSLVVPRSENVPPPRRSLSQRAGTAADRNGGPALADGRPRPM